MSNFDVRVVDLLTTDGGEGHKLHLLVPDHEHTTEFLADVETKIRNYREFILSGELNRKLPQTVGRPCSVDIHLEGRSRALRDDVAGMAFHVLERDRIQWRMKERA